MRTVLRLALVASISSVLGLPVLGAEDKAKKDTPKAREKPAKKWIKAGAVAGKVVAVNEANKSLRIQLKVTKKKNVDVEWQSIDDVKVRKPNPPPQFDSKGRVKKRYTRKELRELKGDPKLPGFPAEFSDLKPGQYVQVTLVRKKGRPRRVKGVPDPEYSPHMSLIVILSEPNR